MFDNVPQPGKTENDPNDSCLAVECSLGLDGNVTRREKEQACPDDCPFGSTYYDPPAGR